MRDPLGRQPRPQTGRSQPDYADDAMQRSASVASTTFKSLWISHPPQEQIIGRILSLRLNTLDRRGEPLDGLRLSQDSQAGKTATMERLKAILADRRAVEGLTANPFQVTIVGIDQKTSLKSVYQDILIALEDPDWDEGTEKMLRQRVGLFVNRLGVELLIVEECQHLRKDGNDVADVTDALKRLLDLGVVPLVLTGNLDSKFFFERNPQLAARLGEPLELRPLNVKSRNGAIMFREFCAKLAQALVVSGILKVAPDLTEPAILDGLVAVSGGHVGRVARLIENALPHAVARGAVTIEPYDLSCLTRNYAMKNKWVDSDPFSLS